MIYDLIIIGGGAAGLCCAINVKRRISNSKILIFEALPRVGKKLAATGNGRCNITNLRITDGSYHGKEPSFAEYALKKYEYNVCRDFFYSIGVPFISEGDKVYPASLQAASVVDALRFEADGLGIETLTEHKVDGLDFSSDTFTVKCKNEAYRSKCLLVAAGLLSGGDKFGCNGSILGLMCEKGYKKVALTPSIVQVRTENDTVKQLKGIKVTAKAAIRKNGNIMRTEYGEVLFCDYGLSGPPILQLSRLVSVPDGKSEIVLDLMPDVDYSRLFDTLKERAVMLKTRKLEEFFTGMLNKRLGQVIIKTCGLKLADTVSTLNEKSIKAITSKIKSFTFKVTGTTGFINSQATAGGLSTPLFDSRTMMSKIHNGLFAAGEILDIDGDCGGFNLQWAWSSSMCAADGICKLLKGNTE